jgi:hypothetical protein
MKKIILLTMTMLGMLSCSVDNEENVQYNASATEKAITEQEAELTTFGMQSCFTSLTADVSVNGGLSNPTLVFTPAVTASIAFNAKFWVRVEIQPLSDCDNLNSNSGSILSFGPATTVQNVVSSPPSISVQPGSLPLCYKWRFVFEGVNSGGTITCNSSTKWKAAPIF